MRWAHAVFMFYGLSCSYKRVRFSHFCRSYDGENNRIDTSMKLRQSQVASSEKCDKKSLSSTGIFDIQKCSLLSCVVVVRLTLLTLSNSRQKLLMLGGKKSLPTLLRCLLLLLLLLWIEIFFYLSFFPSTSLPRGIVDWDRERVDAVRKEVFYDLHIDDVTLNLGNQLWIIDEFTKYTF